MPGTLLSAQLGSAQLGAAQLGQHLRLGSSGPTPGGTGAGSKGAFWWWQPSELAFRMIQAGIPHAESEPK